MVAALARAGVRANHVTVAAALVSIALGAVLCRAQDHRAFFFALPAWMFLRMAANAVDGMLAREHGHKSPLGAYLNELTDVVSDAALYLPMVWVGGGWPAVAAFIAASMVSEMAGAMGPMVGAPRAYNGPMGKSDRAFLIGLLGLLVALGVPVGPWISPLLWAATALIGLNTIQRVRSGVARSQG